MTTSALSHDATCWHADDRFSNKFHNGADFRMVDGRGHGSFDNLRATHAEVGGAEEYGPDVQLDGRMAFNLTATCPSRRHFSAYSRFRCITVLDVGIENASFEYGISVHVHQLHTGCHRGRTSFWRKYYCAQSSGAYSDRHRLDLYQPRMTS